MSLLWIVRTQGLLLLLILQITTSTMLIYRQKNKLSYIAEIIIMSVWMIFHKFDFSVNQTICYLLEYVLMKVLLLILIWISKRFAFYVMVSITHKNSKGYKLFIHKKKFIKFEANVWNNVKYGIRIKKGIPAMVNKRHKRTGVYFDKDGFPKFKPIATIKLNRKLWKKTREVHFYNASKILYKRILKNKKLKEKFTKKEIEVLKNGKVPSQYTWHHHQDKGKLILVNRKIHLNTNHKGGFSIWGKQK